MQIMQSPFQSAILSFFEKCFHLPFFGSFFLFFFFFPFLVIPETQEEEKKGHHLDDPHAFENMLPLYLLDHTTLQIIQKYHKTPISVCTDSLSVASSHANERSASASAQ